METSGKAPVHLWIVGGLSLLWNAFGALDYTMTETHNQAWLSQMTPPQLAYIDSFPAWAVAAWAFGVWGALLGSILLLLRSRYAVWAFTLSLAGVALTALYEFVLSDMPADMKTGMGYGITITIWVIAIALLVYAVKMRDRGVLR